MIRGLIHTMICAAVFLPMPTVAGEASLASTRVIRSGSVIASGDVLAAADPVQGALTLPGDAIGLEATRTLFPGRAIMPGDLRSPSLVRRNDLVQLRYALDSLIIVTEGRALARGARGDRIAVMNLSSRATVHGLVTAAGTVEVTP